MTLLLLLENSGLSIDGVSETVKHEIKKQESEFPGMLLETLGASMLGNIFTGKYFLRAWKGAVRSGRGYNNMDRNS